MSMGLYCGGILSRSTVRFHMGHGRKWASRDRGLIHHAPRNSHRCLDFRHILEEKGNLASW